jgi:threonine/homoserine/homoserine lactone efflux protein
VFLAAVLPQFVNYPAGWVPVQIMILGVSIPLIALATESVWALAAGGARTWFARSPRRLEFIGGAGGFVMIGLGAGLVLNGRKD